MLVLFKLFRSQPWLFFAPLVGKVLEVVRNFVFTTKSTVRKFLLARFVTKLSLAQRVLTITLKHF